MTVQTMHHHVSPALIEIKQAGVEAPGEDAPT